MVLVSTYSILPRLLHYLDPVLIFLTDAKYKIGLSVCRDLRSPSNDFNSVTCRSPFGKRVAWTQIGKDDDRYPRQAATILSRFRAADAHARSEAQHAHSR